MNLAILTGRVAHVTELKHTNDNVPYVDTTLAVEIAEGKTDFIPFRIWNKNAENFAKMVEKGDLLKLDGKVRFKSYKDKNGNNHAEMELEINKFEMLESKEYKAWRKRNNAKEQDAIIDTEKDFKNLKTITVSENKNYLFEDEEEMVEEQNKNEETILVR
ncbi:single-stranded DNA-binding protein [Mycoplasma buteonis]|uniref:single-stranded DNA-binding protein n=1 Tax=Mycoplasma buteonis TaxID=171280 RepID=UPI00055A3C56|nr:single-stranded DNA-binding protein [Mycoplasma buteonis]